MNKRLIGGLLTVLLCIFAVFGLGESVSSAEEVTAEGLTERASFYTITYDANGGNSAPSRQAVTPGETIKLTRSAPTREMYTFLGWSKNKSATTATYLPGNSITPSDNIVLYAVWEKAKSIGTISADKSMKLNSSMEGIERWYEFTVGSTGNYLFSAARSDGNPNDTYYDVDAGLYEYVTRNGSSYLSQIGWHTIGASYQESSWTIELKKGSKYYLPIRVNWNDEKEKEVQITLKIKTNIKTITYDVNGGDRYSAPSKQAVTPGETIKLSSGAPTREMYTFLGWSKNKSATTATYLPGNSIVPSDSIVLYAVWEKAKSIGTISTDKSMKLNSTMEGIERWYEFTVGSTGNYLFSAVRSDGNPNDTYYDVDAGLYEYVTRNGSSYLSQIGWHTIGASYQESSWTIELKKGSKYYLPIRVNWNDEIEESISVRLFIGVPSTGANARTVTYNANGGELGKVPEKQTVEANKAAELNWNVPYREHYNFLGWSKSKTATAAEYLPSGSFTTGTNTTLYAVWEAEKYLGTLLMETKKQVTCSMPQAERWYAFKADCSGTYTIEISKSGKNAYVKAALYGREGKLEETATESTQEGLTLSAWLDEGETCSLCLKPYWESGQSMTLGLAFGIPRMTSRLVLPSGLREIRERAYAGTGFESVVCPENVESIDAGAFADCTELKKVIFLGGDTVIADTAFGGCSAELTFCAPAGSEVQAYAEEHGYSFIEYVP